MPYVSPQWGSHESDFPKPQTGTNAKLGAWAMVFGQQLATAHMNLVVIRLMIKILYDFIYQKRLELWYQLSLNRPEVIDQLLDER